MAWPKTVLEDCIQPFAFTRHSEGVNNSCLSCSHIRCKKNIHCSCWKLDFLKLRPSTSFLFFQGWFAEHFGSNKPKIHKVKLSLIHMGIFMSSRTISTTTQVYLVLYSYRFFYLFCITPWTPLHHANVTDMAGLQAINTFIIYYAD